MYSLENYIKITDDSYYPLVDKLNPDIELSCKENSQKNWPYYDNSILQPKDKWYRKKGLAFKSGLFISCYSYGERDKLKLMIAIRGSDDLYDFGKYDYEIALGQKPIVFKEALFECLKIIRTSSPQQVAFTGHSLGGAIAQYVGIKINRELNRRFPVVSFNAPQIGELISASDSKIPEPSVFNNLKTIMAQSYQAKTSSINLLKSYILPTINNANTTFVHGFNFFAVHKQLPGLAKTIIKYQVGMNNLKFAAAYNKPAFNVFYDIFNDDPVLEQSNQTRFLKDYETNEKQYKKFDFIYSFDSLFDLVHTTGRSVTKNQIVMDVGNIKNIDTRISNGKKAENIKRYIAHDQQYSKLSEIEKNDLVNHYVNNKQLEESVGNALKRSRIRCEFRVLLSQHPNYMAKMRVDIVKGRFSQSKNICKMPINQLIGFEGITATILDFLFKGADHYLDDLSYISHYQHCFGNLSYELLKHKGMVAEEITENHTFAANKYNNLCPHVDFQNPDKLLKRLVELSEKYFNGSWNCRMVS